MLYYYKNLFVNAYYKDVIKGKVTQKERYFTYIKVGLARNGIYVNKLFNTNNDAFYDILIKIAHMLDVESCASRDIHAHSALNSIIYGTNPYPSVVLLENIAITTGYSMEELSELVEIQVEFSVSKWYVLSLLRRKDIIFMTDLSVTQNKQDIIKRVISENVLSDVTDAELFCINKEMFLNEPGHIYIVAKQGMYLFVPKKGDKYVDAA